MYMYVYMYRCIHIHICIYVHICVYVYICIYIYICVYIYIYIYLCQISLILLVFEFLFVQISLIGFHYSGGLESISLMAQMVKNLPAM